MDQKKCENDTSALNDMGWLCLVLAFYCLFVKKKKRHIKTYRTQNSVGEGTGHHTGPHR